MKAGFPLLTQLSQRTGVGYHEASNKYLGTLKVDLQLARFLPKLLMPLPGRAELRSAGPSKSSALVAQGPLYCQGRSDKPAPTRVVLNCTWRTVGSSRREFGEEKRCRSHQPCET